MHPPAHVRPLGVFALLVVSGCATALPSASPSSSSRSALPMASPTSEPSATPEPGTFGDLGTIPLDDDETPPVSSSATDSMAIPRRGHEALALDDGRVLVHGGDVTVSRDDARSSEIYHPETATWTATASTTMERPTLTLVADGRVLATGGSEPGPDDAAVAFAELYDPATGSWTPAASMMAPRAGHTGTLLADGTVLVTGGTDDGSAELYDPTSETSRATGSMVEPRGGHTATLLHDGTVLVTGGYGDVGVSAELYDSATETWRATGRMPQAHAAHTATLLTDGKVLVVGGERMGGPDRGLSADESQRMAADIYDPGTGRWTAAEIMIDWRLYHAAILLPDGRVLVSGGASPVADGLGLLATAEVYDPETGAWSAAGGLVAPRSGHSATLLPDGRVLLAGGAYGGSPPELLPSAELYDP